MRTQKPNIMKKTTLVLTLCLILCGASLSLKSQEMTENEQISYALGAAVGRDFKGMGLDLKVETFTQGVVDAMKGELKFSDEELQAIFNVLNQKMQEQQNNAMAGEKEKGAKFLAENKKQPGVIETPSGLQYKVVKMGDGPKPKATDKVKVHYHGTLIDGTVFDSSVQRGEPITFPLNGVIRGWTEGVQLMPVGSKFIFYIPSELAYGDRGAGQIIKGGATLIFEVELLEINPEK